MYVRREYSVRRDSLQYSICLEIECLIVKYVSTYTYANNAVFQKYAKNYFSSKKH